MSPARPPLPTAANLPFQPDAGIHTSMAMAESLDGDSVAATLQNAGSVLNCVNAGCPGNPPPAGVGGVKVPAATRFANVIIVFGNFAKRRLSQGAARAGDAVSAKVASPAKDRRISLTTMDKPPRYAFRERAEYTVFRPIEERNWSQVM